MARPSPAHRAPLPHHPPPDYALLATGRLVLPGAGPLAAKRRRAVPTAPAYLPRWRYGTRRRRGGGR